MQVVGSDISQYGVKVEGDTPGTVEDFVEKSSFEETPSDMASIGHYIITPNILDLL